MPILDDDDDEYLFEEKILLTCKHCGKLYDEEMPTGHRNHFCYKDCQQCKERIWGEEINSHVCKKPITDEDRKRAQRDRRDRALEQDVLTPERIQPSTGYSKRIQQGGSVERNRHKH